MKKMIMTLLSLSFVGTTAIAFEGVLVPTMDGGAKIETLRGTCPAKPVKNGNYCKPVGESCGAGYDQFAKLCWGGWKKGFYKCGISCKPKEQCGWNPRGDWKCGRPGSGAGPRNFAAASSIEGSFQMLANGDIKITPAKVVCEDQGVTAGDNERWEVCRPADGVSCGEGYQRMKKYCWGGFKKGFYRCGYVCEKPRNANDDGNGGGIN